MCNCVCRNAAPYSEIPCHGRIRKGKGHRLEIKDINVDDSDIYQCNATNTYGSTAINMDVTVLFRTTMTPGEENYIVKAGDSVTMSIKVCASRHKPALNSKYVDAQIKEKKHKLNLGITHVSQNVFIIKYSRFRHFLNGTLSSRVIGFLNNDSLGLD